MIHSSWAYWVRGPVRSCCHGRVFSWIQTPCVYLCKSEKASVPDWTCDPFKGPCLALNLRLNMPWSLFSTVLLYLQSICCSQASLWALNRSPPLSESDVSQPCLQDVEQRVSWQQPIICSGLRLSDLEFQLSPSTVWATGGCVPCLRLCNPRASAELPPGSIKPSLIWAKNQE